MPIYKFRDCLLNTDERSVIKGNEFVELTTKTFDVLLYLVENAGRIVTKDEILGRVWDGSWVEESNLPVQVSKLRRLLIGDKGRRLIETVQGVGYRFLAHVECADHSAWQTASRSNKGSWFSDDTYVSVVVIPFQNESGQAELDYLTDGLTEHLINCLSQTPYCTVITRSTAFKYKDSAIDPVDIARDLGVSNVLTGRIRLQENGLVVGTELTSAADGRQVWGDHYYKTASDLFSVQDDIIGSVISHLGRAAGGVALGNTISLTRVPESCRLYFKGRYLMERRTSSNINQAIKFFEQSFEIDPGNIYAYVEIIECLRLLYAYDFISYTEFLDRTEPVLRALDTNQTEESDAVCMMQCDVKILSWSFDEAAVYCRKALALNPNNIKGRLRLSEFQLQSRNFAEALELLEGSLMMDPLSVQTHTRISRIFFWMGKFNDAIGFLDDALDLEPMSSEVLGLRGVIRTEVGDYDGAIADFHASLRVEYLPWTMAMIAIVYAKQGSHEQAVEMFEKYKREARNSPGYWITIAYWHLALGDPDLAFEFLEESLSRREADLRALTYDRRWLPLHRDQRFGSLLTKMGLPPVSV